MGSQNFEQMINVYHGIYIYCGIAAIAFLVLAAALFILLKIPRVFSELTGRGAKKAIQEMVDEGTATGNLTSRKIGEDGRRHRKKAKTGALGTARLRRRTGLTGSLAGNGMGAGVAATDSVSASTMGSHSATVSEFSASAPVPAPISASTPAFSASAPVSTSAQALAAAAAMPPKDLPSGGLSERSYGAAAALNVSGVGYGAEAALNVSGVGYGAAAASNTPGSGYGTAIASNASGGGCGTAIASNASGGGYGDSAMAASEDYGDAPTDVLGTGMSSGYDSSASGETMVLEHMPAAGGFMVLRSILEIHTDEVIG